MSFFSQNTDIDNISINTAFTDNDTLVDNNSIFTASEDVDDDTATLTNEFIGSPLSSKQKLAKSIVTKSDFSIARIKVVGMNIHPNASDSKLLYSTILSIRYIIRKTREDVINDKYVEHWKIEKNFNDFVQLHATVKY
jgi:hypothetical protein